MRLFFFVIFFSSCYQSRLSEVERNATTHIDSLRFLKEYPFGKHKGLKVIFGKNAGPYDAQWGIIANEKNDWFKIVERFYTSAKPGESHYVFEKTDLDDKVARKVIKEFLKNKIWEINPKDDGCLESELRRDEKGRLLACNINDGFRYELYVIKNGKAMWFHYYEPHYWETRNCCPGNKDRQAFIKCFDAISALFEPGDMKSKPR